MSERQQRVESLLRELTASFIATEANPNPLITITRVSVAPELKNATVYFTTIPEERENDALIFLKRSGTALRDHVKKHSDLRFIPNFRFEVDGSERIRQHFGPIE